MADNRIDALPAVQMAQSVYLNPVAGRTTRSVEAWRWSSARAYLGNGVVPRWLRTEYILDLFGPSNCDANYRDFLADGVDIATVRFYADIGW